MKIRYLALWILLATPGWCADLAEVLDRAARAAQREAAALSSVACTEKVVETRFNEKEKLEQQRRRLFDYLVMIDSADGELAVTESRMEQSPSKKSNPDLLGSTGFATMALILHPFFQYSFRFTDKGTRADSGKNWREIEFQQQPGKKSPSVLRTGNREYPLAWQGEIFVEESTGQVGLVRARLAGPMEDIGLESIITEVRYGPSGAAVKDWVPLEATVDLRTKHRRWRNTHTFSAYRRFDVVTVEKQQTRATQ